MGRSCARQVAKYSKGYTIVVEKSTLPVKTAEVIKTILEASQLSPDDKEKIRRFIKSRISC